MAFAATNSHAATIMVTDAGDAGTETTCTLRQAIVSAN
jgi:CSLREA domain-containing protein